MSLGFETKYRYTRSSGSATTTFMQQINQSTIWVGWSDGAITSHTSLNLNYTLAHEYYFDTHTITLPEVIVASPTATLTLISATRWYDRVWVLFSQTGIAENIASYNTTTYARTNITLPNGLTYSQINSNICAANGKLYIADKNVDATDRNTLWIYTIASGTWTSVIIPGKKQSTIRHIVDGLDGKIYITGQNDHSIIAFNTVSNTSTGSYRINRHPYKLQANQNQEVYVISDLTSTNNTISLFNQSTNTAATFCSGLKTTTVVDDFRTGYVWLAGGGASTMRLLKSNKGAITVGDTGVAGTDTYSDVILLTDNITYDYYNPETATTTSLTVRPHLFIRTASEVIAYRATALKGVNSSEILGTAMIATGAQGYYGD